MFKTIRTKKRFIPLVLGLTFLSACRTSVDNNNPTIDSERDINTEKKRMEIKFSCGENGISKYIEDGWIVIKEESQEKICTWKSVPATKNCDMEKDKGCKITKPDEIGEEKIYLLEK